MAKWVGQRREMGDDGRFLFVDVFEDDGVKVESVSIPTLLSADVPVKRGRKKKLDGFVALEG